MDIAFIEVNVSHIKWHISVQIHQNRYLSFKEKLYLLSWKNLLYIKEAFIGLCDNGHLLYTSSTALKSSKEITKKDRLPKEKKKKKEKEKFF